MAGCAPCVGRAGGQSGARVLKAVGRNAEPVPCDVNGSGVCVFCTYRLLNNECILLNEKKLSLYSKRLVVSHTRHTKCHYNVHVTSLPKPYRP